MRLYNTLSRRVDELALREPGRVSMYSCGPTVQGPPHFGHARAWIVVDVLRRYLEWTGLEVFHVRNITDVEDKIIARAEAEHWPAAAVAEHYTRVWDHDIERLGVLPPHVAPRASGHIPEQLKLIEELVAADGAYAADGDVFFAVRRYPRYGALSGRDVDEMRSGTRVEVDERKRDPLDFALWKGVEPGSPYEPGWDSPWGHGRPGWHLECSAMALRYLGEGFDLHTGGIDLAFPHHENEIAQAEAAGHPFARHWVHNGLLNLGDQKMSKSIGNIISLSEALDRYGPGVLRLFYLQAHYRSPVEFSEARLDEASAAFDRWRSFVRATRDLPAAERTAEAADAVARFRAAMDDDLGTPTAHAVLFDLVSAGNAHLEAGRQADAAALRDAFSELTGVLGYDLTEPGADDALVVPLVEALLAVREAARGRKDFATADDVRDRLAAVGVVVEDSAQGPRWHLGQTGSPSATDAPAGGTRG